MRNITFENVREFLLSHCPGAEEDIRKVMSFYRPEAPDNPDEPARPNRSEQIVDPPKLVFSKYQHPSQGKRPKGLEGLIVHYTAGPCLHLIFTHKSKR